MGSYLTLALKLVFTFKKSLYLTFLWQVRLISNMISTEEMQCLSSPLPFGANNCSEVAVVIWEDQRYEPYIKMP